MTRERKLALYRAPLAGWIFMAAWMSMLVLISCIYLRDGGFHQFNPLIETAIMLFFWCAGLAGTSYMFGMQMVSLARQDDDLVIREYWPLRRRESRLPISALGQPIVRKIRDSEGDDHYLCLIVTPERGEITIASYADEADARSFVDALSQQLGSGQPPA